MKSKLVIKDLFLGYGELPVLHGLNLEIRDGETVALLGPSGCGKTSLLKALAGLLPIQSGSIHLDGTSVEGVPPQKRRAALIFQNYALFPQMTVLENIEYGLKVRRWKPADIREESRKILALLKLEGLEQRPVTALSGGQQQRVAIGRALIIRPSILLFDEPLSNLDENLRGDMRREIREILRAAGCTSLYVTHDRDEALVMADRVAVMREGRIGQIGPPAQLYCKPENVWIAGFLGYRNLFPLAGTGLRRRIFGCQLKLPTGTGSELSLVLIRPEDIDLYPPGQKPDDGTGNRIFLSGFIEESEMTATLRRYRIKTGEGFFDAAEINRTGRRFFSAGEAVTLGLEPGTFHYLRGGQK